jgi:hypothetical protein
MARTSDDYAGFLNHFSGTIDDAELSGFDADGIAHLKEAFEFFSSDLRLRRHSEAAARARAVAARAAVVKQ